MVFLDEAHQFLGRTIGEEFGSVRLDAFGFIAKEDRKHGLSMGMSGDFEIAIAEGATIVRVGQAVFGPRSLPDEHYWPTTTGR